MSTTPSTLFSKDPFGPNQLRLGDPTHLTYFRMHSLGKKGQGIQVINGKKLTVINKIRRFFDNITGERYRTLSSYCRSPEFKKTWSAQDLNSLTRLRSNVVWLKKEIKLYNKSLILFSSCRKIKTDLDTVNNVLSQEIKQRALLGIKGPMSKGPKVDDNSDSGSSEPAATGYSTQYLLDFYKGDEKSTTSRSVGKGPTLKEIWNFNFKQKEANHDYIQWLFPLSEKSNYNSFSPVLDKEQVEALRAEPLMKTNLKNSFLQMLDFYGLKYNDDQSEIVYGSNFNERKKNWLNTNDHNHKRITRILKSLMLFGLEDEAVDFYRALMNIVKDYPKKVTVDTNKHWQDSIPKHLR